MSLILTLALTWAILSIPASLAFWALAYFGGRFE